MATFASFDGTVLSYEVSGSGPPALLLHGFAADSDGNWVQPGVVAALVAAGRQAVALDARGHGRSAKPHDPRAYDGDAMVSDAAALLDHLAIPACAVVGYSMGSITGAGLAAVDRRVVALVLGGMGGALATGDPEMRAAERQAIAEGLETDDPSSITSPVARRFRRFAELRGSDRRALAALQRSTRPGRPSLGDITAPVLVLIGRADKQVGPPEVLAAALPDARVRVIGGDHLSAVNDPQFAPAIVDFLATAF